MADASYHDQLRELVSKSKICQTCWHASVIPALRLEVLEFKVSLHIQQIQGQIGSMRPCLSKQTEKRKQRARKIAQWLRKGDGLAEDRS